MCLNLQEGGYLNTKSRKLLCGKTPWNKGLKTPCESRQKQSDSHKKLKGLYTWVNKDGKDTRIKRTDLDVYIKLGYCLGRIFTPPKISHPSPHKGKICINDSKKNKYINEKDLDYYLKLGYCLGHIGNNNHSKETKQLISDICTGAKFMTNGIENHYVLRDKIDYYLSIGYHFGIK